MRNVTFALVFLVAAGLSFGAPAAEEKGGYKGGDKAKAAAGEAKAALDKFDEAWNAHDAKATAAYLDRTFFGAGPFVSAKMIDDAAGKAQLERDAANGARTVRNGLTLKADENGDAVWFIGEYTFSPKVPPGALPVRRPMRVTGVMVKRGKDWKIAMANISSVQPDPPPAANAAGSPAQQAPSGEPAKK